MKLGPADVESAFAIPVAPGAPASLLVERKSGDPGSVGTGVGSLGTVFALALAGFPVAFGKDWGALMSSGVSGAMSFGLV